jgi:hypothetical protein
MLKNAFFRPNDLKYNLYFHIGSHRTATSALQDYLFRNRDALKAQGYLYPFDCKRHLEVVNAVFARKIRPAQVSQQILEQMEAEATPLHSVVISDEDICMRKNLTMLGKFRKFFNVKVIYTLRRQDLWLESWHLQNIKWQWDPKYSHCTFEEFLGKRKKFHWIQYDSYVSHLEKIFGTENVLLNIYEKHPDVPDPIEAFCHSIGLEPSEDMVKPARVNESFAPVVSEFMRCLPLDEAPETYRGVLTTACAKLSKGYEVNNRLLSYDRRVELLDTYAAGNRALAQRYFGRDELFREPLPDRSAPVADMALPEDSYELMQKFVTPLLKSVIHHQVHHQNKQPPKP